MRRSDDIIASERLIVPSRGGTGRPRGKARRVSCWRVIVVGRAVPLGAVLFP